MRFRPVRMQRFPFFHNMISVLEHYFQSVHVLGALSPVGHIDKLKLNRSRSRFEGGCAKSRLVSIAGLESHHKATTVRMINRDEAGITFEQRLAVGDFLEVRIVRLSGFHKLPVTYE